MHNTLSRFPFLSPPRGPLRCFHFTVVSWSWIFLAFLCTRGWNHNDPLAHLRADAAESSSHAMLGPCLPFLQECHVCENSTNRRRHSLNPCSGPPNFSRPLLNRSDCHPSSSDIGRFSSSSLATPRFSYSSTLPRTHHRLATPSFLSQSRRLSVPYPCNTGVPSQFLTHARLCYGCSWLWRWPDRRQLICVSANQNPCSGHTCLTKFVNSYLIKRSGTRWSESTLALEAGSCVFPAVQFEIIGPWR